MKCSGAEIIVKLLERQGIEIISGIPGGANLPIYDVLHDSRIHHVLARHEQGAGFIAQGMARSTGRAAVCIATSGPGATNLLTAIADAKSDSVPIIAITGQVPTSMIGLDAFQEVDTYGLTLPITKHNFLVQRAEELFNILPESFRITESGRPGPVVIDIPKDIQSEIVEFDRWPEPWKSRPQTSYDPVDIEEVAHMIHESERPVICVGGGIVASESSKVLIELAKKNSIPVTSTLMGLGCFPPDDPLFLGMVGMHGARYTNYIMEETDLLLAFGVRFDDRVTGNAREFCKQASIIHVDVDHSEIDKIKDTNISIVGDVGSVLVNLNPEIKVDSRPEWNFRVARLKAEFPIISPPRDNLLHPLNLIEQVSGLAEPDAIITTDVGQHQMWVAQTYPFRYPRTFLTSGGLGTMGFGLPAAIGAALAHPDRQVVCFSGDGSFMMNIQELATMADQNLNVTVIVMNNNHLGLVRQQQELFYNNRVYAAKFYSNPDFAAIAEGFGVPGYNLKRDSDPLKTLALVLSSPGPNLVNAPINVNANVFPMVPPGSANREMIGG